MKSIGFKVTAVMLVIILLGIIITAGLATFFSSTTIISESEGKVLSETEKQGSLMNEWLSNHKTTINTTAAAVSEVGDYSKEYMTDILKAVLDTNGVYQDVYIGFPDGTAIMGSGFPIETEYEKGWRANERGWWHVAMADTNAVGVTELYVDTATGDLCITVAKAVKHGNEVIGVVAIDILVNFLQNIVFAADMYGFGYSMLLNTNGDIFIHPDSEYAPDSDGNFKNLATVKAGVYANLWNAVSESDGVYQFRDATGVSKYYTSTTLETTGWHMVTVMPTQVVTQPITNVIVIIIPTTIGILLIAALLIFFIVKGQISAPLAPATAFFNKAGHTGDISLSPEDVRIIGKFSTRKDEIGQLIGSAAAFVGRITEVSQTLEKVASGDLTAELAPQSQKDTLGLSMQKMTDNLNHMFGEINSSSVQVTAGAKQVADGAQALAQGSTQQAASIQELSSSITQIAEKTKSNTGLAEKAATLAESIKETAEKGSGHMGEMVSAVNEINDASGSISKVIKVIDDIAFQTNILALNAAVEAARAGQHGKGFAVVADEVRNLATKSAEAAKDTGDLITNSMKKAEHGVHMARDTAESLSEIVSGINVSNEIIDEIAESSKHQSTSLDHITDNIDHVVNVIQQNTATSEESAASALELSGQATTLKHLVSRFKLKEDEPHLLYIPGSGDTSTL